jgi:hypothetical protein
MENNPNSQPSQERVGDDLLIGAAAIGAELGIEEDAVYHIHKKQQKQGKADLPISKWGKFLVASRRRLRRAAVALTSSSTAA